MTDYNLYLSHWYEDDVFVTKEQLKGFKQHHINCLRSIYSNYKKFKGILITYPAGINIYIVIRAFLSAIINNLKPVLLITHKVSMWYNELSKIPKLAVVDYVKSRNNFISEKQCVVITDLNTLKENPIDIDFSIVIGDDIELLVNKMVFKQIGDVSYKIGLSRMEFYDDDLKVLWYILKWCNGNIFGKLIDFIATHKEHYDSFRDPYDEVWHKIDLDLPDDYQFELENIGNKSFSKQSLDNNLTNLKKNSSQNGTKRPINDTNIRQIKKNKSTPSTKQNDKVHFFKAKSTSDVDSIELTLDDDVWIEDYMKEIDISKISNDDPKDISISPLSTEWNFFHNISQNDDTLNINTDIIIESDHKDDDKEDRSSSSCMDVDDVEDYPILDAIIKGSPLKNAVEKYKQMQESEGCFSEESFRLVSQMEQNREAYPILDAIINGSPLKKAMKKYEVNILGENLFDEEDN